MKKILNINVIGTIILVSVVAAIAICFICSNGNYIAHLSIGN